MNFELKAVGIDEVMKRFKNFYNASTEEAVGKTVETYARKMANDAATNAPVKDGFLKNSLASSPQQEAKMTWTFGSDLPYALRQEYEHRSHKGFVRRSIWTNREAYRAALKRRIIEGK
ncbi:hypothetical protein MHZ92_14315 [Sporosarcina sp. ACRSL]|uniref:HK97 gp10 family phage protein n=1 Tax=Sporosarcina sp. ACRSL TaxID=2918215 RepID=UPI001EF71F32|nr:HK97 gp10 family phage protein [Sporosarcina sp. ACRSL]MCG7345310.1 hypothetical protein [Sporosarcina sp. ACRSL]